MAEISPEYIRLHITPFNPTLLTVILPPSVLPDAHNISYHSVQNFPEKAYGYVDLPRMDAEKIKKKLNGSILKGIKVKIEAAKPKKEFVPQEEEPAKPKREKEMKDSKKRKRGQETIPAVEIGERSVKRGWTTPAAAISKKTNKGKEKIVVKSKYTTTPECLFKTVLPPNVAVNVEKKKRKADKTVVHEFEKTTKYATFLRGAVGSKKTKSVAEYVEGKGWVDEDGNIIEEKSKKERKPKSPQKLAMQEIEPEASTSEDDSSEVSSSSDEEADATELDIPQVSQALREDSPTSSSGSSSDEESEDSTSADESDAHVPTQEKKISTRSTLPPISTSRPQSSSGPPSGLSITIPESGITSTPMTDEVHPLEALYKRQRPDSLSSVPKPTPSTFNFFGADADEDLEGEALDNVPLTPFTQRDFDYRGIRSAAPTPDTAHANKRFIWPTENDEDDEEEASLPVRKESPVKPTEDGKTGDAESDFQKWFYENRGDTSRAWKKRRKVVAKEKRQRENRKRNDRSF
ncbi:hypothetical protein D0Z07_3773 [Hyphodiscus hymeniophilus]|uniref:Uncharacterized protein n=1 Tax=Hyphodiscus hymeniophilus TaxID=353542 RepID=A0A9P7AYG7_9HELO|nr:hypothetical protein D0Z07_3773 [Hyphodiscus hymeniophilus]